MYNGVLLRKANHDIAMTTSALATKVHQIIEELCAEVFSAVLQVLGNVEQFGITITVQPSPNAEECVVQTKLFERHLDILVDIYQDRGDLDLVSMLLNAKQRILYLEMLINAAKQGQADNFERLVSELRSHAQVL